MPMTREERCELLKLAREAKAKKKLERDADKEPVKRGRKKKAEVVDEPMEVEAETVKEDTDDIDMNDDDFVIEPVKKPKSNRVKKEKEPVRTLELNNEVDVEDDIMVEEVVEIRKKPKKKVVKKIIYESDSEDEVEEVVVQNNKPKKEPTAKVKKVAKPVPLEQPKEPEVKPQFSFFNC